MFHKKQEKKHSKVPKVLGIGLLAVAAAGLLMRHRKMAVRRREEA